jgi:hypothetical protein
MIFVRFASIYSDESYGLSKFKILVLKRKVSGAGRRLSKKERTKMLLISSITPVSALGPWVSPYGTNEKDANLIDFSY